MEKVYEVQIDVGSVETVKGVRAYVECGVLHIEGADGKDVAIFAKFDYLVTKSQEKTE